MNWKKVVVEVLKAIITILSAGAGAWTAMKM